MVRTLISDVTTEVFRSREVRRELGRGRAHQLVPWSEKRHDARVDRHRRAAAVFNVDNLVLVITHSLQEI